MASTIYNKSLFAQYFTQADAETQAWATNVLAKMVAPGQVAKYVKRTDEEGNDTDFERLFRGLLPLLSYVVRLGREFQNFKDDDFLADAYLNSQGQYTGGSESLVQLQYLISNLLRTYAQRGTVQMFAKSGDVDVPSGELLRLFNWNADVFFKLGLGRPQHNSWNLDNSSPLFRGTTGRYDLNVAWEDTEDVESLAAYPLTDGLAGSDDGSDESFFSIQTYLGKQSLRISNVLPSEQVGIGSHDDAKGIVVNPNLTFEVTFYVAQPVVGSVLTFGCKAFDVDGNEISLVSSVDGSDQTFFFEQRSLNLAGRFYFVRGLIYAVGTADISAAAARLNIGFGSTLRFTPDVVRIVPCILVDNGESVGSQTAYVWNVKVTPCNPSYERCYLNNKNFIDVFAANLSGKYSEQQLLSILRKYFIPYNSAFSVIFLSEVTVPVFLGEYLLLEDGGHILIESGTGAILLEESGEKVVTETGFDILSETGGSVLKE